VKPAPFAYHAPTALDEALALLSAAGGQVKVAVVMHHKRLSREAAAAALAQAGGVLRRALA